MKYRPYFYFVLVRSSTYDLSPSSLSLLPPLSATDREAIVARPHLSLPPDHHPPFYLYTTGLPRPWAKLWLVTNLFLCSLPSLCFSIFYSRAYLEQMNGKSTWIWWMRKGKGIWCGYVMPVSKLLGHVCNGGMGKYRNVTRVQYQNVGLINRETRVNIRM